jgi:hypothetical protein
MPLKNKFKSEKEGGGEEATTRWKKQTHKSEDKETKCQKALVDCILGDEVTLSPIIE